MTLVQKPGLYEAVQFNGSNGAEVFSLALATFLEASEPSWSVVDGAFVYVAAGGFIRVRVPLDHYWTLGPYWGTSPYGTYAVLSPETVADRFTGSV